MNLMTKLNTCLVKNNESHFPKITSTFLSHISYDDNLEAGQSSCQSAYACLMTMTPWCSLVLPPLIAWIAAFLTSDKISILKTLMQRKQKNVLIAQK